MSKLDFKQRQRMETQVLPAVIADPEKAATALVILEAENTELHNLVAYYRERLSVAENFAPPLGQCVDCGSVVAQGYCCGACGSVDPSRSGVVRQ